MKKVLLPMTMLAALVAFGAPMASASVVSTGSAECAVASVKIINDTDGDIQLHTGHGFVELNKGASTSITCEPGTKISHADKGKKGEVVRVAGVIRDSREPQSAFAIARSGGPGERAFREARKYQLNAAPIRPAREKCPLTSL